MPKYVFECQDCNTRFERSLKMGEHPTHTCPSCKEPAPRLFEGFAFGFAESTKTPTNTGVHDQDYPTADKIVGRSADKRWNAYKERDKCKNEVRKVGASPALARLDGPGYVEYAAMSQPQRDARGKLVDYAVSVERAKAKNQ